MCKEFTHQNHVLFAIEIIPMWCHGVVVINTAQFHSAKPELRFCACSNPSRGVLEDCDGEKINTVKKLNKNKLQNLTPS